MNPNTATNEELRDWLANKQGWNKTGPVSWHQSSRGDDGATSSWCANCHPIPNTIDAAAKCLPEVWTECWSTDTRFAFRTLNNDGEEQQVNVARTPEEKTDRFRLAVKAIMAMEEGK